MGLNTAKVTALALLSALAIGCSDSNDSSISGNTGTLSLSLTDAPVDSLLSVFITFTGVSLQADGGERTDVVFPEPKTFDMLTLQNGESATLLDDVVLPAGRYAWMRLDLSEAEGALYVRDNVGGQYPLSIPSGAQTGLKLVSGFIILANGQSDFTIDFDLRKSVTLTGSASSPGDYILRPTLRLVDNAEAGAIGGQVSTAVTPGVCANPQLFGGVVYIFEGANASVDDYDADSAGALVAAPVTDADGDGTFNFLAAFLPVGDYTIAYTCEVDNLGVDESLVFTTPVNITVSAGASATVTL